MSDFFDLKTVGCKVYAMLIDHPATKDNDGKLLVEVWKRESKAVTIPELFEEIINGNLSHFESVSRTRRKLQEEHPTLRGEKWESRHKMESVVCEQLTFFDKWGKNGHS